MRRRREARDDAFALELTQISAANGGAARALHGEQSAATTAFVNSTQPTFTRLLCDDVSLVYAFP